MLIIYYYWSYNWHEGNMNILLEANLDTVQDLKLEERKERKKKKKKKHMLMSCY
jgi:hypothetical protein